MTNDKLVYKREQIKDEEGRTYSLKIEEGKCYFYEEEYKEWYIKINEAKKSIQIFRYREDKEDEEPDYICKKL